MVFAHDTDLSLQAAVALVNSGQEPDTLTSVAELSAFFDRLGYTGRHDRTRAELDEVRALRPSLRALLTAPRDRCVSLVNEILATYGASPQLVRHPASDTSAGQDWHVHAIAADAPLAHRIAVETAMAMIDVIRADEHSRIFTCADESCDGIVLDLSRNRSKRYCSTACTNRNASAAYRARHRT
ncbi:MAG: CGNR zinc finger domain-containing protein [Nocardioides sp.]|nr:CGNR zinc finger domain-containing protein [Nocardioides sp.]